MFYFHAFTFQFTRVSSSFCFDAKLFLEIPSDDISCFFCFKLATAEWNHIFQQSPTQNEKCESFTDEKTPPTRPERAQKTGRI